MKQIFTAIALLILISSVDAQWTYQNPRPTPEGFAAVSFVDSLTGFAVCYSGTLVKTNNAGASWELLQQSGFGNIYCTDIAFLSEQEGFITGSKGRILKTTDGGLTWDTILSGTDSDLLSVFMYSSLIGYITGAGGTLLKTIDGGITWQTLNVDYTYDFFDCCFTSADEGYIAANQRLLKTADGGFTWSEILKPAIGYNVLRVGFLNPVLGFAIGRKGGIFRTSDSGVTWQMISSGTEKNLNGITFLTSDFALISADSGQIIRSTDAGLSWNVINTGFSYDFNGISATNDHSAVTFGPFGVVWQSSNAGVTWKPVNYVSLDALTTVSCVDKERVFVSGSTGEVLKSMDGGQTWRKISTGAGKSINSLVMANETTGYLAGDQGLIMKSTDGGEKWSALNFPAGFNIRSISLRDQNNVLMCGFDAAIYRSTNGGNSWEGVQTGTGAVINSVSVFNNTAYACGTSSTVLKSSDFGVSWSKIVIPQLLEANLNRVQCVDENTCFVIGNQYILTSEVIFFAKTTDGGKNWIVKTFSYYPDKVVFSMFFTDPLTGYLGGSDFLWKTTDGGNNWTEQKPRIAPLGPNAICFADSQVGYAVGYSGQIMKTVNGGGLSVPDLQDDLSALFHVKFPNPVSGPVLIEYRISGNERVQLFLFDIKGKKIATLVDKVQTTGTYTSGYDVKHLPAGVYLLRLVAGKLAESRKLMVIH